MSNINIRKLVDPNSGEQFYPQTDINGLVNNGGSGVDEEPVAGSGNLVQSGGIKTAIDNVAFSSGEKVNEVGVDEEPTAGSDNLVKSRGVAEVTAMNVGFNQVVGTIIAPFEAGDRGYYYANGGISPLPYESLYDSYKYFKIKCKPSTLYTIVDGQSRWWVSVDVNGNLDSYGNTPTTEITTGEGSVELWVTYNYDSVPNTSVVEGTPKSDTTTRWENNEKMVIHIDTDAVPTVNSTNPVQSGGVYNAVSGVMDKIARNDTSQSIKSSQYMRNLVDPDDPDVKEGQYLDSNGGLVSGNYCVSGFIPFNEGMNCLIGSVDGIQITSGGGYICLYNIGKSLISAKTISACEGKAYWDKGVAYARFSFPANPVEHCQVEIGEIVHALIPYGVIEPNKIVTDDAMSNTSDNPVKNKVLNNIFNQKVGQVEVSKQSAIVWESGYRNSDGSIGSGYGTFHGEYYAVKGDKIVVASPYGLPSSKPAILKKEDNNTWTILLSFTEDYKDYSYVVPEDAYICLNYRSGTSTYDGSTGVSVKSQTIDDILVKNTAVLKTGKNFFDAAKATLGKYFDSNGAVYSGNYTLSDYIPFNSPLALSIDGEVPTVGSGYHCVYDANKGFLRSFQLSSLRGAAVPWQEGDAFIRFSIPVSSLEGCDVQIESSDYPTRYVEYGKYIPDNLIQPKNDIEVALGSMRSSGAIANGESLTLPVTYIRHDVVLSAIVIGTLEEVRLGQGDGVYNGGYITVTNTSVIIGGVTTAHGLTLTNRTTIIMSRGGTDKVTIVTSAGEIFDIAIDSSMGGAAYIKNMGTSSLDVELSFFAKNSFKKIWLIGDSYMAVANTRWPYWIKEWGFENYMIDNLPGGGSVNLMPAFENDLAIGQPKIAVWGLGMNDGTDTTTANYASWVKYITKFITLCLSRNITPILTTIPSVPTINNESKNAWVRNSGLRYIDFAKAVNAQSDGTWDTGLIANDGVHPSEAGAKVLASRVLIDFPEISTFV